MADMRQHLFRGKRKDNGQWIDGGFVETAPPPVCVTEDNTAPAKAYIVAERGFADWAMPRQYAMYEVDPATVGEYSDVLDKNGKLICEGDQLCVTRECVLAYGTVVFRNGCVWFADDSSDSMLRLCDAEANNFKLEIIGNDVENKE